MSPNRRPPTDLPTVLIVDDDFDARQMYSEFLRLKGWVAFSAADGRAGIDKAGRFARCCDFK